MGEHKGVIGVLHTAVAFLEFLRKAMAMVVDSEEERSSRPWGYNG